MPTYYFQINIGTIKIDSIESASALNIGRNCLSEFDSMTKTNQGLGKITGDNNSFPTNNNRVDDPDGLDMWCDCGDKYEEKKEFDKLPVIDMLPGKG